MKMKDIAAAASKLTNGTVDIACVSAAATEIAVEYKPLLTKQEIACDGTIRYSAFEKSPVRVYGVTVDGRRAPFRALADRVETDGKGTAIVEYAYRPTFAENDECPFDSRTVAYGAAAEYCLKNSLFGEAAMWDAKFRDSLARQAEQGGYVRRRAWL